MGRSSTEVTPRAFYIVDNLLGSESGKRASQIFFNRRMEFREAFDVHLVKDGTIPGIRGVRSRDQVKAGSMTRHLGTNLLLSRSSNERSSPSAPIVYPKTS
jgi:hypothetical protein